MATVKYLTAFAFVVLLIVSGPIAECGDIRPPAPDLVLRTLDDSESMQLGALRGYPVLLSFWASWCAPCREELPQLAELARELGDRGFFLVAINVDQVPAVGREFLRRYEIAVPAFKVARGDLALIGIDGLPTNILLDSDGGLVKVFEGLTPTLIDDLRQLVGTLQPPSEAQPDGA